MSDAVQLSQAEASAPPATAPVATSAQAALDILAEAWGYYMPEAVVVKDAPLQDPAVVAYYSAAA